MEEGEQTHKSHRRAEKERKGRKAAEKRKEKIKKYGPSEEDLRVRNPRAFAIQRIGKAERRVRRKEDIVSKRQRLPAVDRAPLEPPPVVVAIVGPPKVGKSTLLRYFECL